MKFKRILAMLLALIMLLAMTACGGETGGQTGGQTGGATTPTDPPKTNDDGFEVVETELFSTSTIPRGTLYENNNETMATKKTPEGTLIIGGNMSIVKAEPNNSLHCPELVTIYNRLIEHNIATGEYEPSLATKWEQVDDTTFEVWLRDDVYYHYGQKFTADDVVYTLERLKNSNLDPKWWDQFAAIDTENIEIVDDYHMIFHFNYAWGGFLDYMSRPWGGIMNREYMESNGEEILWDAPNGTGPFMQTDIVQGEKFELTRFENYWGEWDGGYDKIVYKYYSDVATMFIDFEAGNLDIAYQVSPEDCERILDGGVENVNLQTVIYGSPYNLAMYNYGYERGIGNRDVREAIMRSLNTEVIAEVAMGMLGKQTKRVLPSDMKNGYDMPYGYDIEKAREILAASDYDAATPIVMSTNNNRDQLVISEMVQAMMAEAGIENVEIITGDAATHSARTQGRNNGGVPECDVSVFNGLIISSCPQQFLSQFKTGSGYGMGSTQDEHLNGLFVEAERTADEERISEIYEEVAEIFYDQLILTPLVDVYQGVAYHDYVNYWDINWTRHDNLANITLAA